MDGKRIGITGPDFTAGEARGIFSLRAIEVFFARTRRRFFYLHIAMFIVFSILVLLPPFLPQTSESAGGFVSIARFLIWGLWFPLVLLSVIFFGRLWCGLLCPQGAFSEYAGKKGLGRAVPAWMRSEWTPVGSFIFVTIMGQVVGVRDYPLAALEILGGTMAIAALVGFIYARERRAWCRYLCPLGPLLGIFSRLGAVSIEKGPDGAGACRCPTFINTSTKVSSASCIECFRCVNPDSPGSLRLSLRRPGREIEEIERRGPSMREVIFLFAATGLALGAFHWQTNPVYIRYKGALGGFLLDLGLGEFIGRSGPWWLMVNYPASGEVFNFLDLISISTFMIAFMVVTAAVLLALSGISALILNGKRPNRAVVAKAGYVYAPVALVSLVIGLGQMLFETPAALGVSTGTVRAAEAVFFAGGALWSLYIAAGQKKFFSPAIIPAAAGIGLVAFLWQMVLF